MFFVCVFLHCTVGGQEVNILASDWASILLTRHVSAMLAPSKVPWSYGFLGPRVDS